MAYVAAAGPIANLVLAVAVAAVFRVTDMAGLLGIGSGFVFIVLVSTVFYNVVLALFNLLPIPPLDGYNLVLPFLPPRWAFSVQRYAPYGVLVLLLLVFLSYGGGSGPLDWLFAAARGITGVLTGA
jgi:Zn-dependent protease